MKRDDLPQLESGALAWRLDPGPTASVEIWSEIPLSQALSSSTDLAPLVVFLPSGAATPYEVQREAEAWVLADCTAPLRLDLLFRSDRVIWTAERALILGAPDRLPEVKAAVQLFTRLESELRAIEHAARDVPRRRRGTHGDGGGGEELDPFAIARCMQSPIRIPMC